MCGPSLEICQTCKIVKQHFFHWFATISNYIMSGLEEGHSLNPICEWFFKLKIEGVTRFWIYELLISLMHWEPLHVTVGLSTVPQCIGERNPTTRIRNSSLLLLLLLLLLLCPPRHKKAVCNGYRRSAPVSGCSQTVTVAWLNQSSSAVKKKI